MSAPGAYPAGQYPPGGFPAAPLGYLHGAPVSFGEAISQAVRHTFVYRGRASRSAYWWFILFQGIAGLALDLVFFVPVFALAGGGGNGTAPSALIFLLFAWTFLVLVCLEMVVLALTVRRLHDTGRSGWWLLIGLVPWVGAITILVFTLLEGTPGPNQYQP